MSDTQIQQSVQPRIRDDKGRFLPAAGGTAVGGRLITSDNAAALGRRRWEIARDAAAKRVASELGAFDPALADALVNGSGYTVNDAWGMLVARTAVAIANSDVPRGDDLRTVGQCIGTVPRADELAAVASAGQAAGAAVGAAVLLQLVALLTDAGADVVEGQVAEAGEDV